MTVRFAHVLLFLLLWCAADFGWQYFQRHPNWAFAVSKSVHSATAVMGFFIWLKTMRRTVDKGDRGDTA